MFKRKVLIMMLAAVVTVLIPAGVITTVVTVSNQNTQKSLTIDTANWNNITQELPVTYVMTEDEFELFQTTMERVQTFENYSDYVETVKASMTETSVTAKDANLSLFNMCDQYFQCYYGSERVSQLLPMAIANVETPHRADFTVTWSALFPSKYVDVSRMETFDVTDVVSDDSIYKILSDDYSTRDRGALQMSPTYGTGDEEINKLMSGNEKDKLASVDISGKESWVSGAASQAGDRFYLPDVLLRLRTAMNVQVNDIVKNNYTPQNNAHLLAMLGVSHNGGYIWHYSDHSRKVGCWHKGELAYEFTRKISTDEFMQVIQDYADTHSATYIDSKVACQLYFSVYDEELSDYVTKDRVALYPIKLLYSYVKLYNLYTQ